MEIKNILQSLGLQESEIKIYLANLELGITQVANIARISGIKRTTLYGILEKMEEKNIIKKYVKNNISYFEAINPDDLFSIFEKSINKLKNQLPELRAINNKFSNKPKVYFFEGAENVGELYKMEARDLPEEIRVFSSNVDRKKGESDKLRKIRNQIYAKMGGKRANMKLILNRDINKSEEKWDKFNAIKIKKNLLDLGISIKVYGNKVKFISMKENITGVVIENKYIAETMKSIFDYIYEGKS